MKGRQENCNKIEEHLLKIMTMHSAIIKDYYSYIDNKTHNTKKMYVNRVIHYLNSLKDKGLDIDDVSIYKEIKPANIRQYMKDTRYKTDRNGNIKELSDSYRTLQLAAIGSFFDFLIENHYISENPCHEVKLPRAKEDKAIVYLTPNEVATLKNNIKNGVGNNRAKAKQAHWYERDMAIMHLLLHTGLRVSALTEINLEDIDLSSNIIRVTEKENFTRDIFIDEITTSYLNEWLNKRKELMSGWDNCEALFISNGRTRISSLTVNDLVKKYTYNIDKKITPHKLRATFATTVYNTTKDIYITSNLIGHASIETTKRYAAIADEQRRAAVNLIADIY